MPVTYYPTVAGEGDYSPPIPQSDVTNLETDLSAKVAKATYNAHTILQATSDNTPAALEITEQTVVGRLTGGNIKALSRDELTALLSDQQKTAKIHFFIFEGASAVTTGDGKAYSLITARENGMNIVAVYASLIGAKSTSALPTFQIARGRQANATTAHAFEDVLSTRITIDENEWFSGNATTAAVIDTSKDDLLTGDLLRVDADTAGTGSQGLIVVVEARLP